jgi:hypothetical protein
LPVHFARGAGDGFLRAAANKKGWYVCLRPTGGKAVEFVRGSESCQ